MPANLRPPTDGVGIARNVAVPGLVNVIICTNKPTEFDRACRWRLVPGAKPDPIAEKVRLGAIPLLQLPLVILNSALIEVGIPHCSFCERIAAEISGLFVPRVKPAAGVELG